MDEKILEIAFSIIGSSGEAKFIAKEALKIAREDGDIEKAKAKLEEARISLNNAHRKQTELISKQANNEKIDITVVLIHAQDHLMTTMSEIDLTEEFINVYTIMQKK